MFSFVRGSFFPLSSTIELIEFSRRSVVFTMSKYFASGWYTVFVCPLCFLCWLVFLLRLSAVLLLPILYVYSPIWQWICYPWYSYTFMLIFLFEFTTRCRNHHQCLLGWLCSYVWYSFADFFLTCRIFGLRVRLHVRNDYQFIKY